MKIERILTQLAGISGMGKSYLAKKKLIPAIAEFQPVIVFDKMGEYAGANAKDSDKSWKKFPSIFSFLSQIEKDGSISGVNVIECKSLTDYDHGIRFVAAAELPVCLILDEAHFIFDEPTLKNLSQTIKNIARFGRHKNMSLVLISQRIMDVPPDVRSQFEGLISFKQAEKGDIDSLKSKGWEGVEKILDFKRQEFQIFGVIPQQIKNKLL